MIRHFCLKVQQNSDKERGSSFQTRTVVLVSDMDGRGSSSKTRMGRPCLETRLPYESQGSRSKEKLLVVNWDKTQIFHKVLVREYVIPEKARNFDSSIYKMFIPTRAIITLCPFGPFWPTRGGKVKIWMLALVDLSCSYLTKNDNFGQFRTWKAPWSPSGTLARIDPLFGVSRLQKKYWSTWKG